MNDAASFDAPRRLTARALLVGDRIDTAGLERPDMISSLPLAFHAGANGMVALFRFGVAVMVGLTPLEEEDVLDKLKTRVSGLRDRLEDETAILEIAPDGSLTPGSVIFETSRGDLDASVDTQLAEIDRGLTDALKRRK